MHLERAMDEVRSGRAVAVTRGGIILRPATAAEMGAHPEARHHWVDHHTGQVDKLTHAATSAADWEVLSSLPPSHPPAPAPEPLKK